MIASGGQEVPAVRQLQANQTSGWVLEDVLAEGLAILFCGTAPGTRSAAERAYYAHPGNRFWRTLHEVGLTPMRIGAKNYRTVLAHGIGLTDLAKQASGPDASLRPGDFDVERLRALVESWRPAIVAFTSKRAGEAFFGRRVDYGLQPTRQGGTRFFVLNSPSGLASGAWQQGRHWRALARLARVSPQPPP